jgi:hypothetical protein
MTVKVRIAGLVTALSLLLAGAGLATAEAAGASGSVTSAELLRGSVPRLVSVAQNLGALHATQRIKVALPLLLPHRAAMNRYVSGEYTPGSPHYRQFLTPSQFGARFGAPAAELQHVESALRALGLSAAPTSSNRLYVSAVGSAATLERVFGVRIDEFRLPDAAHLLPDYRTFYANAGDITLPASLRGAVTGVVGLDDSDRPVAQLAAGALTHKRLASGERARSARAVSPVGVDGGATPCAQAIASGGYTAPQLAQAYNFNGIYAKGFHGEGMSAALVEFDDFHNSNSATMKSCYGVKTPVTRRLVDGGVGGPPAEGEAEDMADITTLLELDPKLAHLYVYEAPITGGAALFDEGTSELDLYNAFVSDDKAPVLSASWGNCEETQSASYQQLFASIAEEAAAQGQQMFDASGDSGAVDCEETAPPTRGSLSVEMETAIPWITGVGGTDLSVDTTEGVNGHHEDTWNDGGAGGGGQSNVWTMPSWQAAYLSATSDHPQGEADDCGAPAGQFCRMVPDISMNADPDAGTLGRESDPQFPNSSDPLDEGSPGDDTYCATSNCSFTSLVGAPRTPVGTAPPEGAGGWYPIGGTSLATPTAAAAAVLWDQEAKAAGLGGFGFLNPSLYRVASNKTDYAKDFYDITTDSNDAQYDSECPTGCNPSHLYSAGTGYDMASGLGSVNVANLGADLVKQAQQVDLTPSSEAMYGYVNGATTTAPVSVTSGYRHSTYTASSSASWLHVSSSRKVPGTLPWHVDPTGLSKGTYTGHITVTGQGGSTATLTVSYTVGPRATVSTSPSSLQFSEQAINSSGQPTAASCGSTVWNDEIMTSPDFDGGDYDTYTVDPNSRQTLEIKNTGPANSTLHYEAFFHTYTSSWLTEDMNPNGDPSGFQTSPSQPLAPTSGTVSGGSSAPLKLASIADVSSLGGYPALNQGTYTGEVDIRDLADPSTLVKVPVTLVLGTGKGTPTIAPTPSAISATLKPGKSTMVHLALSDSSKTCGYVYSLSIDQPWATVNPDLMSGTVAVPAATAAPSSPSDTGQGNGYTPITISAKGLKPGTYHAAVRVDSEDAVTNPMTVPITLTVPGPKPPPVCRLKTLTVHFEPPSGTRVVKAWAYIDGKLKHTYKGSNLRSVTFARPKLEKFSIRVVNELTNGAEFQRTASYVGCKRTVSSFSRVRGPSNGKQGSSKHARAPTDGLSG